MQKIKIGLAGGGTQHNAHMRAYTRLPHVEITAVCALPEDVTKFAKQWGISKIYTDLEKLCKDRNVDVVDIALPNYLHASTAVCAAENGKAVFCEKPLATNAQEAKSMVEAIERNGVYGAYLENYSYFPWAEEAKRLVENEVLGKPVWMRFTAGGKGPYSPWFFQPEEAGGGCLIDLGCHFLEVHRWILGKKMPLEAFGWIDTLVNKEAMEGGTEDYSLALVKYTDTLSQCETSWGVVSGGEGFILQITGTEGTFSTGEYPRIKVFSKVSGNPYLKRASMRMGMDKGWLLFPFTMEEFIQPMTNQLNQVLTGYREDKEPRHTFQDGLIINEIMDAIYKSAKTKKWEKI